MHKKIDSIDPNDKVLVEQDRVLNITESDEKPGKLAAESFIILQTLPAQRIFVGKKEGPVGLLKFSSLVLKIWYSAQADDPYADLYLLKIYENIVHTRRRLQELEDEYLKIIKQPDGVQLGMLESKDPKIYPLKFTNPYSYMATYMIVDFDRFVRIILSAKYRVLIDEKECGDLIASAARMVRQVLSMPLQWQYTGVTRHDIECSTAVAERAQGKMGELNEDVLLGKLRAPYAPYIKLRSNKI